MGTAKFIKRLPVSLLVLVALVGVASMTRVTRPSVAQPRTAYGNRLALADLDGDNLADRAELGGTGLNKNIRLRLSRTGQFSVLSFDTATFDRGSLLAQDVNDDGEVDLIWTDLVHPEAVVIWLNNGLGNFERACPGEYGDRFTIGGFRINQPVGRDYETSIGFYRVWPGDSLSTDRPWRQRRPIRPAQLWSAWQSDSIALAGPPADRAPPLGLI
jgi:hypothetical protein